jgi:hypothetical protein
MKTASVKIGVFGCYLGAVLLVWSSPEFNWWVALTAKGVLFYCGLIVFAHLEVALFRGWRRWRDWLKDRDYAPADALKPEGV